LSGVFKEDAMSMLVELKADSPVALLRLNKPPVNALDEAALHELTKAVDNLEDDPAIRVVIIGSALKGIFCAGGDLKFWPRHYANQAEVISEGGQRAFGRIERLTKPCIAAIQGHVIGDGLSLALACDIRLASQEATFHLPEVSYGFIPGWGTIGRLVHTVGTASAAELLLVGEPIDAAHAQAIGLINRVTAPDDLMFAAESLAARLAAKPPMALHYAKAALIGCSVTRTPDQTAYEGRCFAAVWGSQEWEQGLQKLFSSRSGKE
jgi:enoyl-CoA hydratase/carnithine racemase